MRLAAACLIASCAIAAHAGSGVAYVTNQEGGVTVIDLASLEVTGSVDMGKESPRGLGVTGDGKYVITANREKGAIAVVDAATLKIVRYVKIGKNPEFVRIRGDKAYVSFEPSAKGGPPKKDAAGNPLPDDDDDEAKEPARVAVVDLKRWKLMTTIKGGPETEGIEFSQDGKRMLVTNEADNTVTVHALPGGKLLKTIPTKEYGNRPRGIKVSPDGKTYLATLEFGNKFMVLDSKYNVLRTVDTAAVPYGVAFDRAGKRIFVATARGKLLQVFDATSYALIKEIPIGERCWHFTFTPDDKQILLACGRSHEVIVIDAETYTEVTRIADKELPWGIVTYPTSMGSLDVPR